MLLLRKFTKIRRWRRSIKWYWMAWTGLLFGILFLSFQIQHPMYFRKFRNVKMSRECSSREILEELVYLTKDIHEILSGLNLTDFLLYGSHWGAIRVGGPLPWDDDVDLGLIADSNYISLTEDEFVSEFTSRGMTVTNNMAQKTSLKVTRGVANVDVIVYYDYNGLMKRQGWEPFLIPVHYRLHHSFPTWVVKTPPALPTMRFGVFNMSVPRGEREVMKYLYRYNWWQDFESEGDCDVIQW